MNTNSFAKTSAAIVIFFAILLLCCACSAKPIDRAKITEYEDLEVYDSFYAYENIFYDVDDDFDIAFDYFCAVYDPEKNIIGFDITATMYPKYEKTIKDYGIYVMIDENLRGLIQTIETASFVPIFSDAVIQLNDDHLYLTYEPYVTPLGMSIGNMFYSIPLDGLNKEDIIKQVKEGLYFQVIKNKKLGPLHKAAYNGEIFYFEEVMDPNGSQEHFSRGRKHRLSQGILITDCFTAQVLSREF